MSGYSTIASIIAGYKAGELSESAAKRLLRNLGVDEELSSVLAFGAGIVGGVIAGDIIGDAFGDIFDDLF